MRWIMPESSFLFPPLTIKKKKAQSRLDLNCWQDIHEEKPEGQVKTSVRTERDVLEDRGGFVSHQHRRCACGWGSLRDGARGGKKTMCDPETVPQVVNREIRGILRRWLKGGRRTKWESVTEIKRNKTSKRRICPETIWIGLAGPKPSVHARKAWSLTGKRSVKTLIGAVSVKCRRWILDCQRSPEEIGRA